MWSILPSLRARAPRHILDGRALLPVGRAPTLTSSKVRGRGRQTGGASWSTSALSLRAIAPFHQGCGHFKISFETHAAVIESQKKSSAESERLSAFFDLLLRLAAADKAVRAAILRMAEGNIASRFRNDGSIVHQLRYPIIFDEIPTARTSTVFQNCGHDIKKILFWCAWSAVRPVDQRGMQGLRWAGRGVGGQVELFATKRTLPLPVCATPTLSRPLLRIGHANCCMGLGLSKPASVTSSRMASPNVGRISSKEAMGFDTFLPRTVAEREERIASFSSLERRETSGIFLLFDRASSFFMG